MVKPIFSKEKFPPQQHFMRQLKNESAHGDCSKATYCCSQYGASFRDGLILTIWTKHTLLIPWLLLQFTKWVQPWQHLRLNIPSWMTYLPARQFRNILPHYYLVLLKAVNIFCQFSSLINIDCLLIYISIYIYLLKTGLGILDF